VLELDPTDHDAHFAADGTLERQRRDTDARRRFRIAVALDAAPDYRDALERSEARRAP